MISSVPRLLPPPTHSFFLFGPRGVGKSTWLKSHFPHASFFNLLETQTYLELARNPNLLESKIGKKNRGVWICIDEIQRAPELLNEVHRLIEDRGWRFAMSGSSARKLRRGGVNLLAGRAITRYMEPFSFKELGKSFELGNILQWGCLPLVVQNPDACVDILNAYVQTYIKEEIKEEGLVRKVEPFLRFLEIAGAVNGQQINVENISRESSTPRNTVETYFSILEETLLGHWLPSFRPQIKMREQVRPKFYWFDSGVARAAANLIYDPADSIWLGMALETFIFHELRAYNHVTLKNRFISFYRTQAGQEIDFVIETRKRTTSHPTRIVCMEVKHAKKWDRKWEGPIRSLQRVNKVKIDRMIGIYMGQTPYHFDGFDVLPVSHFLDQLYDGQVF